MNRVRPADVGLHSDVIGLDISAPDTRVSRDRKCAAAIDAVGEVERNSETARPK
jgi:hypothetical protein